MKSLSLIALLVVVGLLGCTERASTNEEASGANAPGASLASDLPAADQPTAHACDGCALARLSNRECKTCGVRYVAGLEIPSEMLFELLDAHGHTYNPSSLPCQGCREASATNGLCAEHRWGFAKGQLYFSKLSYLLAQGKPQTRETLPCTTCQGSDATIWCDRCGHGWVGNVAFTDPVQHSQAIEEYEHLVACVETAAVCEKCAAAKFSGMKCPTCKTTYPRR